VRSRASPSNSAGANLSPILPSVSISRKIFSANGDPTLRPNECGIAWLAGPCQISRSHASGQQNLDRMMLGIEQNLQCFVHVGIVYIARLEVNLILKIIQKDYHQAVRECRQQFLHFVGGADLRIFVDLLQCLGRLIGQQPAKIYKQVCKVDFVRSILA